MKLLSGTLTLLLAPAALFCQTTPRPEFEVASVKPSPPIGDGQFSVGVHIDGAMVRCNYLTLRNYLAVAYDVKDYQIVAPEWMSTDHFDISAKLPAGGTQEQQLRAMVASLLTDRFKMVVHRETRDLPAYALIVNKDKLKLKELPPDPPADPADPNRDKVDVNVNGGGRGGTTVNLGNGSYITYGLNKLEAKKVTLAMLLESLGKFVDRPIIDTTGLTGRYDITLEYSVDELKNLVRSSGGDPSHIPDMGDPNASIFSSLESLGLKLDPRKSPVEVVVVDKSEKTPTAN